jgi:hypothetical protein
MNPVTNRLFSAAGLGLAATLFLGAKDYPYRAATAARYIFFLAGVLALLSVIMFFRSEAQSEPQNRWIRSPRHFLVTVAAMAGYGAAIPYLGFFLASALFMPVLALLLDYRRPLFIAIGTGVILLFVYLVFVYFLGVPVPMGIWEG